VAQSELRVSWVATIVMLLCTLQLIDYVYAANKNCRYGVAFAF